MSATTGKSVSKKKKLSVSSGIMHISTSMNNIIISFTDPEGNVLLQESSGTLGYKGTKKSTSYVANLVASKIGKEAKELGVSSIAIHVKGIGRGKEIALRTIVGLGFEVTEVADKTPLQHNGCTPSKKPR
ncbi:30S ribosomal protein S11 [Candidatus Mycoplasma haematominutum]|uniref:Small ribosomal subunit protein uS11 n=1 Tax=Candidatus Mycoplasma haematominutum 'Birmingham 1' TaxID=1116213 RepID=G8C340_9MOLU|nr:30S ribosomal protein S11 [Candidatus Mycoplasma haematominutum]CCE66738.1 ribosomal protein S11 [Candidatus Mycoplasma haematominutum 'Birmingham 1']